jgi:16S rRNA (guanine527-N7)-methyltransferase
MPNRYSQRLSAAEVASALVPFGLALENCHLEAISRYVHLLRKWNQSVSITSLDDPLEIVSRHFGESLFAASGVPIEHGRLADVGTGGGFPGLALKMVYQSLEVVLLEPNQKKCAFLNEVVQTLNLSGVTISMARHEDFPSGGESFNYVCSRALGGYSRLLRWAREVLTPAGKVILWLGTDESIRIGRTNGWIWDLPMRIPESRRRVILSGRILEE